MKYDFCKKVLISSVFILNLFIRANLHSADTHENGDGRPAYMKLKEIQIGELTYYSNPIEGGAYASSGPFTYPYTRIKIPVIKSTSSAYSLDLAKQQEDLGKFYNGNYEACEQKDLSLRIISKPQSYNPPVVLFLHGSEGGGFSISFIQEILNQGMAYVSFDRFGETVIERTSDINYTAMNNDSWNAQTELPLNAEVMMVYGVCKWLVEHGTEDIHIVGHSRGGTLTLESAKERNAKYFRNISVENKVGGVKSYTPISAMPLMMGEPITESESVSIVHGIYDTVCPYDFMKYYYNEHLQQHKNIKMVTEECGHIWDQPILAGWGDAFLGLGYDIWENPYSALIVVQNFLKDVGYLALDIRAFRTEIRAEADNFNNVFIFIEGDSFGFVLADGNGSFEIGEKKPMSDLPRLCRERMTKGVVASEVYETQQQIEERIKRVVTLMAASVQN